MSENPTTPRRPLVPGPSSVSQRAIATREAVSHEAQRMSQARAAASQALEKTNGGPPHAGLAPPTHVVAMHPTPVGHIAGAIAAVMSQVGTIEKGGKNEYFGYKYARMEDLLRVITPLMGKHGLAIMQNEIAKEILEGNRLAVTYEFSIFHSSNEIWPEKPRFTGMCISRDRKGNWDDKAIAKCHTNARKYFLLALFQVPAGDFDDADAEDANQRQERRPVPGPSAPPPKEITPEAKARASEAATDDGIPHKIVLGAGSGADQWASAFIRGIGKANSPDEVKQWDKLNDETLQRLSEQYPGVYDMIQGAVERRISDLSAADGMPNDPGEALNWAAAQLAQLKSLEAAEAFWNQYVAPREQDFEPTDWELLMQEWNRTEARINPPDDEPPEAA